MKRPSSSLPSVLLGGLVGSLAFFTSALSTRAAEGERPNIVIILVDDLGYGDLACQGHPRFKTPVLDRMAAEGIRLTQFNCPAPVCAPNRGALMTGRYPIRSGMTRNPSPDVGRGPDLLHLAESELTLPQLLHDAGYVNGMVGKWHLGHARPEWMPHHRGFDEYFGIPYSNDMRPVEMWDNDRSLENPVVQATVTQRYTARALDFIERSHRKNRPFFLYFSHMHVHKPIAPGERFYRQSGAGIYGDAVAEVDWSVGQVLAKLADLGIDDRTLVVFTSDNGAWWGGSTGGLRGMKGSSYEGAYRVPCIARWPGVISAGQVSAQPAVLMDLFTTALTVAGVDLPSDRKIDGQNILPLLASGAVSPHEFIFGSIGPTLMTVRDARWKLHVLGPKDPYQKISEANLRLLVETRSPDGVTMIAPYEQYRPSDYPGVSTGVAPAPMQLFDLEADPSEQRNVAPEHPEVVARLKRAFDTMVREAGTPSANTKRQ